LYHKKTDEMFCFGYEFSINIKDKVQWKEKKPWSQLEAIAAFSGFVVVLYD